MSKGLDVIAMNGNPQSSKFQWDLSPKEAIELQKKLREMVSLKNELGAVKTVAGVDVGFLEDTAYAAVVVLSFPQLKIVDESLAKEKVTFPYIPGLLAFREGPAVMAAFKKLKADPDLIIFDAQGLAHPRRLGLASHLGVLLDRPSIGCAKSKLCGTYNPPPNRVGAYTFLKDRGEIIGAVLRSRANTSPLFVSVGHKIDLKTAVNFVLRCCRGYRLPEPTRLAHKLASGQPLENTPPSFGKISSPQTSLFDRL